MRAVLAVLALALALPATAGAQAAELGLGRRLDRPLRRAPEPREPPEEEPDGGEDEGPWPGPQIQVGYSYWKLADGYGGGDTHTAAFEVFVHWPVSELRTGVLGEIGGRHYSLAGDDLLFRGAVEIGFQLTEIIEPLVPHISFVGTAGGLVGERFETTVVHAFGGAGIELGAALRVVRNFHLHASLSYLRLEMDGAAFDVFAFRVGAGL